LTRTPGHGVRGQLNEGVQGGRQPPQDTIARPGPGFSVEGISARPW